MAVHVCICFLFVMSVQIRAEVHTNEMHELPDDLTVPGISKSSKPSDSDNGLNEVLVQSDVRSDHIETEEANAHTANMAATETSSSPGDATGASDDFEYVLYRKLFSQKRLEQVAAVKRIILLGSHEKQNKMLEILFKKLFEGMTNAKVKLMQYGFSAGDPFPSTEEVRDVLSFVTENTAFIGDLVLHLPDISHSLLDRNTQWQYLVTWAIGFCNDSRIFVGTDAVMLTALAQELNIIERRPDYVNPYAEKNRAMNDIAARMQMLTQEDKLKAKQIKAKKPKQPKGPKLSTLRRVEL